MSSSDSRMFEDLVARVDVLEGRAAALVDRVGDLEQRVNALTERVLPQDVSAELYGAEADHTADRAERAEISRRVPRPPGGGR